MRVYATRGKGGPGRRLARARCDRNRLGSGGKHPPNTEPDAVLPDPWRAAERTKSEFSRGWLICRFPKTLLSSIRPPPRILRIQVNHEELVSPFHLNYKFSIFSPSFIVRFVSTPKVTTCIMPFIAFALIADLSGDIANIAVFVILA